MHRETIEVYEREGAHYAVRRGVQRPDRAVRFATAIAYGRLRLDLGSGPGHYLPHLGHPAVVADAAHAMASAAHRDHGGAPAVQADLVDLPFGRGSFGGVWASKAHQHVPATDLPLALADVHRVLDVGGRFDLTVFAARRGSPTHQTVSGPDSGDDLPGRLFTWWEPEHLAEVITAAGFRIEDQEITEPHEPGSAARIDITATAERALPDHVGAGMRLLCCGLNPSLHAADAGIGYVTGSNRFWRALASARLSSRDRDPRHLLRHDRIGMTDLVHRATPRAAELSADEYRTGLARLARTCGWLRPAAVAMVGLAGWRAARDRGAVVGWQPEPIGPTPAYVLPSTSGLNARVPLDELAEHLRTAAAGPP